MLIRHLVANAPVQSLIARKFTQTFATLDNGVGIATEIPLSLSGNSLLTQFLLELNLKVVKLTIEFGANLTWGISICAFVNAEFSVLLKQRPACAGEGSVPRT